MNTRKKVKNIRNKGRDRKKLLVLAAAVLLAISLIGISAIAFLNVGNPLEARQGNDVAKQQMQEIEQGSQGMEEDYNENMKVNTKPQVSIKYINDIKINEITTGIGIEKSENDMIQKMVVDFIKAEYRSDTEALKDMCTDEFKRELDKRKGAIVGKKRGDVKFSTITNVVREGDLYLVFVRVSDDLGDSEYQWNFEIKKVNGKFLVSSVELDV
ncbi:MAG: hypothetical protein ACOYWZ_21675 [Bacillota bacterium]